MKIHTKYNYYPVDIYVNMLHTNIGYKSNTRYGFKFNAGTLT